MSAPTLPWWRFLARRRVLEAEVAALRVALNDHVARTVEITARLDAHAEGSRKLVEALRPMLKGQGLQLLDHAWWLQALREVGSTTRRTELDRLHAAKKAAWVAENIPADPPPADAPAADAVAAPMPETLQEAQA